MMRKAIGESPTPCCCVGPKAENMGRTFYLAPEAGRCASMSSVCHFDTDRSRPAFLEMHSMERPETGLDQ